MDVSFIIPALNEEEYIEQCLNSIMVFFSSTKLEFEIIVVDNGSTDNTCKIANNKGAIVIKAENVNVGSVRNFGAKSAKGRVLCFIDADCEISESWVSSFTDNYKSIRAGSVYGGGIILPNTYTNIEKDWLLPDEINCNVPKKMIGACIIVNTYQFGRVSGFDENISSGEDTKLHNDFDELHIEVNICRDLSVIHNGNAKNIFDFSKRQIWHSENYIRAFTDSLRDPVFYLVLVFSLSLLYFSISVINGSLLSILGSVFILLISPYILTVKRVNRSKGRYNIFSFSLYILDFVYLLSRTIGLLKGVVTLVKWR